MKTKWSKFEILVTGLSVAIMPLTAWLLAAGCSLLGRNTALLSFAAFFFVPLFGTALLVRFLKRRGKRVLPAAVAATVLVVLLSLALKNHVKFARLVNQITGYYNLEGSYFLALFALLICGGALVGIGAGALLSKINRETAG